MDLRHLLAAAGTALLAACASQPPSSVAIVEPADGATVTSPFVVRFAVKDMAVVPAGTMGAHSGHHHLLIDVGSIAAGEVVPASPKHLHFGKGQTETQLTLPPGAYKLTAQFANGMHESYGPAYSQTITVTVK